MGGSFFVRLHESVSSEFLRRRRKNAAYSLRAFGRDLGLSAAVLSCFLSRKRNLSRRNAYRVASGLKISHDPDIFQVGDVSEEPQATDFRLLTFEELKELSDWVVYGVLSLSRRADALACDTWLALQLKTRPARVRRALALATKAGLVKIENGKLIRTSKPITTTQDCPSGSLRKLHGQFLNLAKIALERAPVLERDFGATTALIDPSNIPRAKRELLRFRRRLVEILSKGRPSKPYVIATHLFELKGNGE